MTRFRSFFFIALAMASSMSGSSSRAQAPTPVRYSSLIGVVRGDGILLPLASGERDGWTVLRSFVSNGDKGLFELLDAPRIPREGWTYVGWDTGDPRPLVIQKMVTTDAHCSRQEGFATNAPKAGVKLEATHMISGIAIHGNISAVRVEHVAHQPDNASRRVARFIVQLTHALEAERASAMKDSPRARIPEGRDRVPVEITTLARDRIGEVDYYFFESRKRYGRLESYANGWLASSPFSVSIVSIDGGIYSGGETSRRRGRVLGVLRRGRASVWIMEMLAYEGVSYDIVEMPRTGPVLSLHGGGC